MPKVTELEHKNSRNQIKKGDKTGAMRSRDKIHNSSFYNRYFSKIGHKICKTAYFRSVSFGKKGVFYNSSDGP